MEGQRPHRLPELDGLRGVLAVWVWLYHAFYIAGVWKTLPNALQAFLEGGKAVDVFIILSGFVISLLLLKERQLYRIFIGRRFLRLYPVYIVCLMGAVLFQAAGWMPFEPPADQVGSYFLVSLTMLQGAVPDWMLPGASTSILAPAWSVSLEWQFYLVAPLLVFTMSFGIRGAMIGSLVCVLIFRVIPPTAFGFLPTMLHLFWVGIASALLYHWTGGEAGRLRIALAACMLAIAAALLLLPYRTYVGLFVWMVVFAAVLAARSDSQSAGRAMDILRSGPILALGLMSYPIYLAHWPWLWFCQNVFDGALGGPSLVVATFAASIPMVLASAYSLHRWIEVPFIRWGGTRFQPSVDSLALCGPVSPGAVNSDK